MELPIHHHFRQSILLAVANKYHECEHSDRENLLFLRNLFNIGARHFGRHVVVLFVANVLKVKQSFAINLHDGHIVRRHADAERRLLNRHDIFAKSETVIAFARQTARNARLWRCAVNKNVFARTCVRVRQRA